MMSIRFWIIILCSFCTVCTYAITDQERQKQADEKFRSLIQKSSDDPRVNQEIYRKLRKYLKKGQGSHKYIPSCLDSGIKPNINVIIENNQTALGICLKKIKDFEDENIIIEDISKVEHKQILDIISKNHYNQLLDILLIHRARIRIEDLLLIMPASEEEKPNKLTQELLFRFDCDKYPPSIDDLKKALSNYRLLDHILKKDFRLLGKDGSLLKNSKIRRWVFENKIPAETVKSIIQKQLPTTRDEINEDWKTFFSRFIINNAQRDPEIVLIIAEYAEGMGYNIAELARDSLRQFMMDPNTVGVPSEHIIRRLANLRDDEDFLSWAVETKSSVIRDRAQATVRFCGKFESKTKKLQESLMKYLQVRNVPFEPAAVQGSIEIALMNRALPTRPHSFWLGKGFGECAWMYTDEDKAFLVVTPDKDSLLGKGSFNKTFRVLELREEEFKPVALRIGHSNDLEKIWREMKKEEVVLKEFEPDQKGINVPRIIKLRHPKGNLVPGTVAPIFRQGDLFHVILDIDRDTRLTPTQKLELKLFYFIEAAEGVINLHKKNIVHFDLKPANVLVGRQTKVHDFGLSKNLNAINLQTFMPGGTFGYFAPESFNYGAGDGTEAEKKERVKKRDVFALGVMLADELVKLVAEDVDYFVRDRLIKYTEDCQNEDKSVAHYCFLNKFMEFRNEISDLVKLNRSSFTFQQRELFRLANWMMDPNPDNRPHMEAVAKKLKFNYLAKPRSIVLVQPLSVDSE